MSDQQNVLDVCDVLDVENNRLHALLYNAQTNIEELKNETAASEVIPRYRLAITR